MSTFTASDVAVLQNNGNLVTNSKFLRGYNPSQLEPLPSSTMGDIKMRCFLEKKYLLRYWHEVQAQAARAAATNKLEQSSLNDSNHDQGFYQPEPTATPNSAILLPDKITNSCKTAKNKDSQPQTNTYISYDQENFADFTVFEKLGDTDKKNISRNQDSKQKNKRHIEQRKRSDSSSNTLDSVSSGSCSPHRTTSGENSTIVSPTSSTKYDPIAQLDLEMKLREKERNKKTTTNNNVNKQQNTYRNYVKTSRSQRHNVDTNGKYNSNTSISTTDQFFHAQYGSPTSTGHALFGVLPQNSPLRAQHQQRQQQQASTNHNRFSTTNAIKQSLGKTVSTSNQMSSPSVTSSGAAVDNKSQQPIPLRATQSVPGRHILVSGKAGFGLHGQQLVNQFNSINDNNASIMGNSSPVAQGNNVQNVTTTQFNHGATNNLTKTTKVLPSTSSSTNPFLQ